MTTALTDAGGRSLKKRLHNKQSAGLPKLAHELINQLSVISLWRCKISKILACDPKKPTQDCAAFDIADEKVTAEYVYQFDVSTQFDPNPKNTPDEMKLSALVFINPTTLLVLERTDLVAKLYSVDMTQATNILKSQWNDPKTDPTLEALADPASAQIRVLPKSLVLDLSLLPGMPEKIEGIALLDRNTIAVANDNDFDSEESKYDDDGNNVGKGKKSHILFIQLSKALPLP